jgi:flavin-dependent dehydrogenase
MGETLYLRFFPIGEKEAYVGCGSLRGAKASEEVNRFLHEHRGEILEKQARQLRINLPAQSLPFYRVNVVGIGGSVGTVSSFGDGNESSAATADLLAKNLTNLSEYQRQVFKQLKWLKNEQAYYKSLAQKRKLNILFNLVRRHANNRKRYQVPWNPFDYKKAT